MQPNHKIALPLTHKDAPLHFSKKTEDTVSTSKESGPQASAAPTPTPTPAPVPTTYSSEPTNRTEYLSDLLKSTERELKENKLIQFNNLQSSAAASSSQMNLEDKESLSNKISLEDYNKFVLQANQGNSSVAFCLGYGLLFDTFKKFRPNQSDKVMKQEAIIWFKKASEKQHIPAMYALSKLTHNDPKKVLEKIITFSEPSDDFLLHIFALAHIELALIFQEKELSKFNKTLSTGVELLNKLLDRNPNYSAARYDMSFLLVHPAYFKCFKNQKKYFGIKDVKAYIQNEAKAHLDKGFDLHDPRIMAFGDASQIGPETSFGQQQLSLLLAPYFIKFLGQFLRKKQAEILFASQEKSISEKFTFTPEEKEQQLKLSKQDDSWAVLYLAHCHQYGKAGFTANAKQGSKFYVKAMLMLNPAAIVLCQISNSHNMDYKAASFIASHILEIRNIKTDDEAAFKDPYKAHELYTYALALTQKVILLRGLQTTSFTIKILETSETERALKIFKSLSRYGHGGACFQLGVIYKKGLLQQEPNPERAKKYFEKAKNCKYSQPKNFEELSLSLLKFTKPTKPVKKEIQEKFNDLPTFVEKDQPEIRHEKWMVTNNNQVLSVKKPKKSKAKKSSSNKKNVSSQNLPDDDKEVLNFTLELPVSNKFSTDGFLIDEKVSSTTEFNRPDDSKKRTKSAATLKQQPDDKKVVTEDSLLNPQSKFKQVDLAWDLYLHKRVELANKFFQKLYDSLSEPELKNPDGFTLRIISGHMRCLGKLNEMESAHALFERYQKYTSVKLSFLHLIKNEDPKKALAICQEHYARKENQLHKNFIRVYCHILNNEGMVTEAKAIIDHYLATYPLDDDILIFKIYNLSKLLQKTPPAQREATGYEAQIKKILDENSDEEIFQVAEFNCLCILRKYPEALKLLEKNLKNKPLALATHRLLSKCGRFAEADRIVLLRDYIDFEALHLSHAQSLQERKLTHDCITVCKRFKDNYKFKKLQNIIAQSDTHKEPNDELKRPPVVMVISPQKEKEPAPLKEKESTPLLQFSSSSSASAPQADIIEPKPIVESPDTEIALPMFSNDSTSALTCTISTAPSTMILKTPAVADGAYENATGLAYARDINISQNWYNAIFWFEEAAKKNNFDAIFNLAFIYYYGMSGERNHQKSFAYLNRLEEIYLSTSDINYAFPMVMARSLLANIYTEGSAVTKNLNKANDYHIMLKNDPFFSVPTRDNLFRETFTNLAPYLALPNFEFATLQPAAPLAVPVAFAPAASSTFFFSRSTTENRNGCAAPIPISK